VTRVFFCFWRSDFIDLTEDNVRNRCLTAAGFLLLYIYFVFTVLGSTPPSPLIINSVDQVNIISNNSKSKWACYTNYHKILLTILPIREWNWVPSILMIHRASPLS